MFIINNNSCCCCNYNCVYNNSYNDNYSSSYNGCCNYSYNCICSYDFNNYSNIAILYNDDDYNYYYFKIKCNKKIIDILC